MRALLVNDETKELFIGEYENPSPKVNELLISIKATALNRADLLQKKGLYPSPEGESPILGLEMAGVIEKTGENVTGWKVGERIFSLLPGGGYAEKVCIPAGMAMRIPDNFSFEQASAIPEAFLTAYLKMIKLGGLQSGEHVLIHAGASGVGTAAIQLAKEVGASPIVTAGTTGKLEFCKSLGANCTINYKEELFSKRVMQKTEGRGVELILDFVGASHWEENIKSIAIDGRWILIATLGGGNIEINLRDILKKRIQIKGSTLRSRSIEEKINLTKEFFGFSKRKFEKGHLIPIIDSVYDWKDANEAHKYLEANKNIGKIVLKIS